jgi:hypothetical protein
LKTKSFRIAILLLLIVSVTMPACSPKPSLTPVDRTNEYPAPEEPIILEPYPSPVDSGATSPEGPYPAPLVTEVIVNPYPGPGEGGGYEPVPGDEAMDRGQVFLDLQASDLLILESYPIQAVLVLRGDLPTSCHEFRAVVSAPDQENRILVEAYSVVAKDQICTQTLQPFEVRISLGSFAGAKYSVWINGKLFTDFES